MIPLWIRCVEAMAVIAVAVEAWDALEFLDLLRRVL